MRRAKEIDEFYRSRITEKSEQFVYIETPIHSKDHHPFSASIGSRIWVEFHASDGTLCGYWTRIHGMENIPTRVWKIDSPEVADIEREQRREFVRVLADIEAHLEIPQTGESIQATIYTRDISGGGMSLMLPRSIVVHPGNIIHARFYLPTSRPELNVKCLVIRVSDRNAQGFASASVQFINIKESIRQQIIRYTFERQRLLSNLS